MVAAREVDRGPFWYWPAARRARRAPGVAFPGVAGILLAAGQGVRYGASPRGSKLLVRWRRRTLVERCARTWAAVGFGDLIVVTGHAARTVAPLLRRTAPGALRLVHNRAHARGLGTSVRLGARHSSHRRALLFGSADMPALGVETLRRIVAAGQALGNRVVVPTIGGEPRNPVYFPLDLRHELAAVEDGRGGKVVLAAHPERVFRLPMDEVAAEFVDVDRPVDLVRIAAAPQGRTRARAG